MNEALQEKFKSAGITSYALAAESGVRYPTVNKLLNGKLDINRVAAETVDRLAMALDCTAKQLLNPYIPIAGRSGHYGRIGYRWEKPEGKNLTLVFKHNGREIRLETEYQTVLTEEARFFPYIAQMRIDQYLSEEAFEQRAEQLLRSEGVL